MLLACAAAPSSVSQPKDKTKERVKCCSEREEKRKSQCRATCAAAPSSFSRPTEKTEESQVLLEAKAPFSCSQPNEKTEERVKCCS